MSKIGKLPIKLPANTTLTVADNHVTVAGPLGTLDWQLPLGVTVQQADGTVLVVNAHPEDRMTRPAHGLARARLANMVMGVSAGFERILDISGVGFRVEVHEPEVWLHVGLSHPVKLVIIPGVSIKVVKNEITLNGIDKESVGEMAARLRAVKKPEPYKGKGIKYREEIVRRKQGKTAKTTGTK
ncbi:MAG: 50S ribosomal protein L6 [Patescibacteria group bacterium]|jgi:large subunit ribosomal protein L6